MNITYAPMCKSTLLVLPYTLFLSSRVPLVSLRVEKKEKTNAQANYRYLTLVTKYLYFFYYPPEKFFGTLLFSQRDHSEMKVKLLMDLFIIKAFYCLSLMKDEAAISQRRHRQRTLHALWNNVITMTSLCPYVGLPELCESVGRRKGFPRETIGIMQGHISVYLCKSIWLCVRC